MPKSTAIYVRVSHRDQTHASQLPDLERWVDASGEEAVWYTDKFTGRTMDRPGMEKLLSALRSGKLNRIVVWRLDRLGRTTKGLCDLFDELRDRSVDLVSLKDGFSLDSPAGRLHARILASVAEYETEIRAERVAAGQAAARRKGKSWGGSEKGCLCRFEVFRGPNLLRHRHPLLKVFPQSDEPLFPDHSLFAVMSEIELRLTPIGLAAQVANIATLGAFQGRRFGF